MKSAMADIERRLRIELPPRQSAFLWGPRKTGKSTWLHQAFPQSIRYDFLNTDVLFRLAKQPHLLREELQAASKEALDHPVILDEVQKVPSILDEVHWHLPQNVRRASASWSVMRIALANMRGSPCCRGGSS
jgi:predicted AAA+ superfamily ATPase